MNKVKAVIFDMDGVLVDSEAIVRESMRKGAEKYSLPFEDDFYELFLGCNDEMTLKILYDRYHDQKLAERILDDSYALIMQEYADGNVHLKNGCRELLSFMKENGIPYALATGSSYEFVKMDFLNNGYDTVPFEHVVTGDMILNSKPDPEIFIKAAASMDQDIKDCLIIEDSPKGLEAAYHSGARSCFIPDLVRPRKDLLEKADYCCSDLFELMDLIKDLI